MRQPLSKVPTDQPAGRRIPAAGVAVLAAIALSAVLAAVAIADQVAVHSLSDHASAMYAPYGKDPSPGLLYGLIYTVAGLGALLWLTVLRSTRARRRLVPVATTVVVTAITASLALTLLVITEYGSQIFPPLWAILAALPPAVGIVAAVRMRRPTS